MNHRATVPSEISAGDVLNLGINEPWKLWHEGWRLISWPVIWGTLRGNKIEIGVGWRIYGRPTFHRYRGSRVTIGRRYENRNWRTSNAIGIEHPTMISTLTRQATIEIGDDVGISGGVIAARSSVRIGDRTLIGANVLILDNDFHQREPDDRRYGRTAIPTSPITIGSDVFIGTRAVILKGTSIGDRSIVGAGSIVSGEFPADSLIAGAPARLIGRLLSDGRLATTPETSAP